VTVLDATNRLRTAAQAMRGATFGAFAGMTKADVRAAVNACDDFIDTNAAAFNTALPTAARTNLTAQQKLLLFCYVAMRRAGLLHAEEDG